MKWLARLFIWVAIAGMTGFAAPKPNIVLIFADDLGWKDVGFNGSDFHETPNLDRMAKEGMVFSQAYASAGNCAPSRACMLSGTYTPRHHVYAVNSTERGPKAKMRLIPVPNKSGLAPENVTMAEALKKAGYVTGIFGKWHLGGKDGAPPGEQGFDVVVDTYHGAEAGGETKRRKREQRIRRSDDGSDPKGVFSLTDAASEFIEQSRDKPFFCFLSHHAIHTRLEARAGTLAKFKAKNPGSQHDNPLYAACLYDMDASIGVLVEKLRELELEKNTLVIFTSDNGGTQKSSQEPLRGSKGGYYEGGIREPFIAHWPGTIRSGSECRVPIINVDLYPTFLEIAGAQAPEGKVLDGESILPLLRGGDRLQRSAVFWHFPGYLNDPVIRGRDPVFRTRPVSVIRKGDWKLHLYHEEWLLDQGRAKLDENRAVELYNIVNDPGEREDVAVREKAKRDELLGDLLGWFERSGAKLPSKPPEAE